MKSRFEIVWDGDFPSLRGHRLSISLFAEPLAHLLAALRRVASQILVEADDDTEYGLKGGRISKEAYWLDLEIESITDAGCVGVSMLFTGQIPPEVDSFSPERMSELQDDVAKKFLSGLQQESHGTRSSGLAREFLKKIPDGVSAQSYQFFRGDELKYSARVEGSSKVKQEESSPLPAMTRTSGQVIGLGFSPWKTEVQILSTEGERIVLTATSQQVEKALTLRGGRVEVCFLSEKQSRLLWIRNAELPFPDQGEEEILDEIVRDWNRVLERLAQ